MRVLWALFWMAWAFACVVGTVNAVRAEDSATTIGMYVMGAALALLNLVNVGD